MAKCPRCGRFVGRFAVYCWKCARIALKCVAEGEAGGAAMQNFQGHDCMRGRKQGK